MSCEYVIPDCNAVVIGQPWTFMFRVPQDMSGFGFYIALRHQQSDEDVYDWSNSDKVTIGTYEADEALHTTITLTLLAADTSVLAKGKYRYIAEVINGKRWLFGNVLVVP